MTRGSRPRPVPNQRPRAVIYCRRSSDKGLDESISLELQETACRDYCARQGYDVVAVEADPGISGRTWKRPGVLRVMQMVEAGEADVIVLWKWSRLSRRNLDWYVAIDKVETAGGRIESATESVEVTSAAGRFQRGMFIEMAAFQSDQIGEGWQEVLGRRVDRGLPASGKPRYGYRAEGKRDQQRFVQHLEQAPVLRWCYEQYLLGRGAGSIARELNRLGHYNVAGREWSTTVLLRTLDSGFGAGLLSVGARNTRQWRRGAHDPVISEVQWRAYRSAREARATVPPHTQEPRYPLSGLIRCGDCGAAMHIKSAHPRGPGYQYLCGRWRATRASKLVTVTRAYAERRVLEWLAELAADVDAAAAADRGRRTAIARAKTDARAAAREVADIERKLAELTAHLVDGTVPKIAYGPARDTLLERHAKATAQLADAEQAAAMNPGPSKQIARGLLDEWDELPARARRDLLATLIRRVEVHPSGRRGRPSTIAIVPVWAPSDH